LPGKADTIAYILVKGVIMGVSPTSVRLAAAASLCVGALLTASAPALATPSNDDTILPAEQKIVPAEPKAADTTVKPASDLQGLLDSLSQTFNDTIGRQLNAARDTVVQQQATNVATSIAVPIANGAAGTVPAVAGSAASALVFTLLSQNVGSAAQSAASTASFASLPAFSVPTMAAWSAPALPAVGLPQLPTLPAFGLPALPGVGLPQMPAFGPPALPELPSFGPPALPQLPSFGLPSLPSVGFDIPGPGIPFTPIGLPGIHIGF
jgi:hypothetical protein